MEKDYSDKNELFEAVCKIMEAENNERAILRSQQKQPTVEQESSNSMASMFSSVSSNKKPTSNQPKFNVADILQGNK